MEINRQKRAEERSPYSSLLHFTVLSAQPSEHQRIKSEGQIIDVSKSGVGLVTDLPLEPGHVLMWEDNHKKGSLHIAMVRWSKEQDSRYRVGLMFI